MKTPGRWGEHSKKNGENYLELQFGYLNWLPDLNRKKLIVEASGFKHLMEVQHILGAGAAAWFFITVGQWSPLKTNGGAMVRCFAYAKRGPWINFSSGTSKLVQKIGGVEAPAKFAKHETFRPANAPTTIQPHCLAMHLSHGSLRVHVSNRSQIPWQINVLPSNKIHVAKIIIICEQSIFGDKACKYLGKLL